MSFLFILFLAIALALIGFVVQRALKFPGEPAQEFRVTTPDHWNLSVYLRAATPVRFSEPILFAHGLANNARIFDFGIQNNLMRFLAALGFNCYAVDFRGAGNSKATGIGPWEVSVDTHIDIDAPALIDFVLGHANAKQLIWVGHSLGGIIGLCTAAVQRRAQIKALVVIGSPVYFALDSRTNKLLNLASSYSPWDSIGIGALKYVSPLAGFFRFPTLLRTSVHLENMSNQSLRWAAAHSFAPLWSGVIRQLSDWARNDVLRNTDKTLDYRESMKNIVVPVQLIGGTLDLLAPPDSMMKLQHCLSHAQLSIFGKSYGHSTDYGHGDLILGNAAPLEVFPLVAQFILKMATPIQAVPIQEIHTSMAPLDTSKSSISL